MGGAWSHEQLTTFQKDPIDILDTKYPEVLKLYPSGDLHLRMLSGCIYIQ